MEFLKKLLRSRTNECSHASTGEIMLGYGQHEITIQMERHPVNVALSIQDPCDGCTVCHGDINRIGVTIRDDGFVLYADIKTNTACVCWLCETR